MTEQYLKPFQRIQNAIQLAGFHYIVCLKAVPTNADYWISIEKKRYSFESIRTADSTELHGEFQRWAAKTVLRDLIEDFSFFLTEVYRNAIRAPLNVPYSATFEQFERKGIEDQLAILSADFPIDAAWISRLTGYNRARNCLAHRQGIVGPRDVTDGNDLVVRWLVAKAEASSEPVKSTVEAIGPMRALVEAYHVHGGAVRFEVDDKERRISSGAMLNFFPEEILEICLTFQMAAAAFSGLYQTDQ